MITQTRLIKGVHKDSFFIIRTRKHLLLRVLNSSASTTFNSMVFIEFYEEVGWRSINVHPEALVYLDGFVYLKCTYEREFDTTLTVYFESVTNSHSYPISKELLGDYCVWTDS